MPQDPAAIQRQIEQTRADLAQTLDAIADMVSPRRVADRANAQIRNKVVELRQKILPDGQAGRPALEPGAGEGGPGEETPLPAGAAAAAPARGAGETQVVRTVRWDRVILVAASLLLLVRVTRRRRAARRR